MEMDSEQAVARRETEASKSHASLATDDNTQRHLIYLREVNNLTVHKSRRAGGNSLQCAAAASFARLSAR